MPNKIFCVTVYSKNKSTNIYFSNKIDAIDLKNRLSNFDTEIRTIWIDAMSVDYYCEHFNEELNTEG